MKFIHTADLHLGKVFHDVSLLEDQRHILMQLAEILQDPSFGALVVSGDVYDRSIPPPDAVALFSGFLGQLKFRRPDLEILVLPGNHDSAARLGFGRELFESLGIHFVTDTGAALLPVVPAPRGNDDRNLCAFFLLPFLHPGDYSVDGEPVRSQDGLAREAAARLEAARTAALERGVKHTVLGAHLFASGGAAAGSERVFLGNAGLVDVSLFSGFDYVALGHLHRRQQAGVNAWYAGSPLAYSFGETKHEKAFLSVEFPPGSAAGSAPELTAIPARPLRKMISLSGSFRWFFEESVQDREVMEAESAYLEISLQGADLTSNPLPLLRRRFPFLLSVRQDEAFAALRAAGSGTAPDGAAARDSGNSGKHRGLEEDFADFLADIYGADFSGPEKSALFRELLAEAESGDRTAAASAAAEPDGESGL